MDDAVKIFQPAREQPPLNRFAHLLPAKKAVQAARRILCALLLLAIIYNGLKIRSEGTHNIFLINTACFFYLRAETQAQSGHFPRYDTTTFGPNAYIENYPPGTAYLSVWIYRLTKFVHNLDFYKFANQFPLLLFVLTLLVGHFTLRRYFSELTGFCFSVLFALVASNAALKLTSPGYFTSELPAVFFLFLAYYFIIRSDQTKTFSLPLLGTFVMLISTYQPSLSYFIIIALTFLTSRPSFRHYAYLAIYIIGTVIIATCWTRYMIGIDYSPIETVKELLVGVEAKDLESYKIAFRRNKLNPMDFKEYSDQFTLIFFYLLIPGLIRSLLGVRQKKYRFILIGNLVGFILIHKYIKFRFIAYPFILLASSVGMAEIFLFPKRVGQFYALIKKTPVWFRKTTSHLYKFISGWDAPGKNA